MNYTDIEWIRGADGRKGLTWNPIKGICPVGCWYCYAKGIYRRFKLDPTPRLDEVELRTPLNWADEGKRIFVCSTFELFYPVADKWRDAIFDIIALRSDMTFIILTKMPERIDRSMPDNVWLGVSVTQRADLGRIDTLTTAKARVKFASFEPLLEAVVPPNGIMAGLNWAIIGRLTGHGKKRDPSGNDLTLMHNAALMWEIPLFMKNNLAEIRGIPLRQEWPK